MLVIDETQEEAVQLASDVRSIHAQGGLEIRSWLSNSSVVIESRHDNSSTVILHGDGKGEGTWNVVRHHDRHSVQAITKTRYGATIWSQDANET